MGLKIDEFMAKINQNFLVISIYFYSKSPITIGFGIYSLSKTFFILWISSSSFFMSPAKYRQ